MAVPVYIPTNIAWGLLFLHFLVNNCLLLFWLHSFWLVWNNISLWFGHAFSWWLVILRIFSCVCWPSVCLLWKKFFSDLLLIFWEKAMDPTPVLLPGLTHFLIGLFAFHCWASWVLCIFWILTPYQLYHLYIYLLPLSKLPFHFIKGFLCYAKIFQFDIVQLFI